MKTAARSLVEVSGRMTEADLGQLVDEAVRRRITTYEAVERGLHRVRPAPGRSLERVRLVLAERLPGFNPGDSVAESRLVRVLRAAGHEPTVLHRLTIDGQRYELDLALVGERVSIEFQSFEFHRDRSPFDRDLAKRLALQVAGWATVEVGDRTSDAVLLAAVAVAVDRQRRLAS